jgi:hypothetical protein
VVVTSRSFGLVGDPVAGCGGLRGRGPANLDVWNKMDWFPAPVGDL